MNVAIRQIVDSIKSGCVFDSHFVIARLIKLHPDKYLFFAGGNTARIKKMPITHGLLAKKLTQLQRQHVIERVGSPSFSENIKGRPSKCSCWRKL